MDIFEFMLLNKRAALLDNMREPFRTPAEKNAALYREFGGVTPDDAVQNGMNVLWLQSVTDGSESYQTYLVSPLWQLISSDVLLRDGHRCAACGRDAEVVHHRSYGYEAMAGLDDSKLISLCNSCHRAVHFDQAQKTPKEKWDKRLGNLRRSCVTATRSRDDVTPAPCLWTGCL